MKDAEEKNGHVTYHHNWYDHSDSRHPRIRSATVHVYNNYFDGNAKYGVGMTYGGHAFVENNYFRSTAIMKPMLISLQGTDAQGEGTFSGENGGIIKAFGNKFDCAAGKLKLIERTKDSPASMEHFDCYAVSSRNEKVPDSVKALGGGSTYSNFDTASDFYEYYVDTPEQAKEKVQRYAGRLDGGDLSWTFDNEKEDGNYAVIPELKAAVVGYNSSVVKIGEVAVSGGGSTGGSTGEGGNEGGDDTPVTPPATIEGEIIYLPQTDDKTKAGLTISGSIKSGKATATIDGLTITKTLEFDSSASIVFTAPEDKDYVLKMYLSVASIKNNGTEAPSSDFKSETGYYVYTYTVAKGTTVTLSKRNTTQLFKLVLTPKA